MLKQSFLFSIKISCVVCFLTGCHAQVKKPQNCGAKISEVYKSLNEANNNPSRIQLDEILKNIQDAWNCDSSRGVLIDLKVRVLLTEDKFIDAENFVDSLSVTDFTYAYKKTLLKQTINALNFKFHKDSINEQMVYHNTVEYLTKYIQSHKLTDKEFTEVFTELFEIETNVQQHSEINKQIDSLKGVYPEKSSFFEFFRHQ